MAVNETREPTRAEIMEEIKKFKDEVIKSIEGSRISIRELVVTAIGILLLFFGLFLFVMLISGVEVTLLFCLLFLALGFAITLSVWSKGKKAKE